MSVRMITAENRKPTRDEANRERGREEEEKTPVTEGRRRLDGATHRLRSSEGNATLAKGGTCGLNARHVMWVKDGECTRTIVAAGHFGTRRRATAISRFFVEQNSRGSV